MIRFIPLLLCATLPALLSSCSSGTNSALRSSVEGRGKLTLDPANPYLAPNRFLSEEAEASETLKGFLTLKGSPRHITFKDSFFSNPRLTLYYEDKNEKYLLENIKKDWVISGPISLDETVDESEEESNALYGSKSPPLINLDEAKNVSSSADAQPSTPAKEESSRTGEQKFEDIFHLVRFQGESIEFIAQWYTSDISNTSRIRSINSLPQGPLREGTTIRVPSYLLKKRDAPDETDVKKFISSFR